MTPALESLLTRYRARLAYCEQVFQDAVNLGAAGKGNQEYYNGQRSMLKTVIGDLETVIREEVTGDHR